MVVVLVAVVVVVGRTVVVVVGVTGRGSCDEGMDPDASTTGIGLDVGQVKRITASELSRALNAMTAAPLTTLTPGTPTPAGMPVCALRSRVTKGRHG